jgi:hypothetical protein
VSIHVNADNLARAETDRMFHDLQANAGGINRFLHNREPASIDGQTVIRFSRHVRCRDPASRARV